MAEFETVLRTPDLGPGSIAEVQAHGRDLAVANVGQTYYALEATCPVDGTNLAREGRLVDDLLVCPHDDARFDVRTGERIDGRGALQRHEVRVEGNDVRVGPPGGSTAAG
ncbi:MAG TPA: Rieske 2Fe-2S domain-containing protein [Longimicrobiales bacterium]|nr:Rieske 2Fe-2S domain-containing protein [Longimicrobiales bacterium]